jgi:hypothetical protein
MLEADKDRELERRWRELLAKVAATLGGEFAVTAGLDPATQAALAVPLLSSNPDDSPPPCQIRIANYVF